jgi:hypothetical protein
LSEDAIRDRVAGAGCDIWRGEWQVEFEHAIVGLIGNEQIARGVGGKAFRSA